MQQKDVTCTKPRDKIIPLWVRMLEKKGNIVVIASPTKALLYLTCLPLWKSRLKLIFYTEPSLGVSRSKIKRVVYVFNLILGINLYYISHG